MARLGLTLQENARTIVVRNRETGELIGRISATPRGSRTRLLFDFPSEYEINREAVDRAKHPGGAPPNERSAPDG